jgi:hypothetical protein
MSEHVSLSAITYKAATYYQTLTEVSLTTNRSVTIVSMFQESYNPSTRVIHCDETFQDLKTD